MDEWEVILQVEHVTKAFPGVVALDDVSFDLRAGEIHALVGENGAGKSTLIKILAGIEHIDSGRLVYFGKEVVPEDAYRAQQLGLATVFQEFSLSPNLSVAENIFCGRLPSRQLLGIPWAKFVDSRKLQEEARRVLSELGMNLDPNSTVGELGVSEQQMVEIAKALSRDSRIIILDEPTAALSITETDHLLEVVNRVKSQGVGVVFVTHRLEEVFAVADRITVLRDGQHVATMGRDKTSTDDLISKMVGRQLTALYPDKSQGISDELLRVEHLSSAKRVQDVSFTLSRGEILGFSGLVGAGRTELARAIFGARVKTSGRIWFEGKEVTIKSPDAAVDLGICYMTEDRKNEGLFMEMNIVRNITAASLREYTQGLMMNSQAESRAAQRQFDALHVVAPSMNQKVATLSGGNQQKVMIGKWLTTKPRVLICDEVTRGIDVGAKAEVHSLLRELCNQGIGIILISSELPEILGLSDRILVMCNGKISGELSSDEATDEKILACAVGQVSPQNGKAKGG